MIRFLLKNGNKDLADDSAETPLKKVRDRKLDGILKFYQTFQPQSTCIKFH